MNVYDTVTDRIITALDAGIIPWRKEWKASGAGARIPSNYTTGRMYRGANIWLLSCSAYQSNSWLTYKQAQEIGAQVRKGSKGTPIVYWQFDEGKDAASGEKSKRVFSRTYTVFNSEQVDGLPQSLPFEETPFDSIASAQGVADSFFGSEGAPELHHAGGAAYYLPSRDEIVMPPHGSFSTPEAYYAVLYHEMGHATGHANRLKRDLGRHTGDHSYSKEELIAEFTSAFLCAHAGINNERLDANATAYIQGWLRSLKNDKTMALQAAQRAQRASDFILKYSSAEALDLAEAA